MKAGHIEWTWPPPKKKSPIPRFGPTRLINWEPPLTDQPETPCPWKPSQRRREGWLEGCCEWGDVTAPAPGSLLQRQRERGWKRQTGEKERKTARLPLLAEVRTTLRRRALAPVHHLSVTRQSGTSRVMFAAAGAKGWRGENGKILLHRCGHRLIQIALEMHKNQDHQTAQGKRCPWLVNITARKTRQMVFGWISCKLQTLIFS